MLGQFARDLRKLRRYPVDAARPHESQRNSLSQDIRIALLETAQGNHVNLAIEQGHQVKFKVNLVKNRSLWAEFNEEVNVRALAVIATGH